MDTNPAATVQTSTSESYSARPRKRDLWQVPTFFLGVVALTGACLGHPLWRQGQVRCLERSLAAATQTLQRDDASVDEVLEKVSAVLEATERYPQLAARAHLLIGEARLRQAATSDDAEARQLNTTARSHLEQADRLGVSDAERARLVYALARVWERTGEPARRVIDALEESAPRLPPAEAARAYALLTDIYLRPPQLQITEALAVNRKLLDLPTVDEELLAPARLLRGELLLKLQSPAEAREALKYIKPPAPPHLIRKARYIEARTYQDEGQWARAARNWQELLDDREPSVEHEHSVQQGMILYNLGVCYRHLDEPDEAARVWERAMRVDDAPEAPAAALALAELRLLGSEPVSAMDAFTRAVREVQRPEDWSPIAIELSQVREIFERGWKVYHNLGRYDSAMQLARLYARVAPHGEASRRFAQAAQSAARVKRERSLKVEDALQLRAEENAARELYRLAAVAFDEAAEALSVPVEQGNCLWLSVECHLQARNPNAAVPVLERFVKLGQPTDKLGEAWFLLGETRHTLGRDEDAVSAYAECIRLKHSGPHAYRARYQIALHKIARGAWDEAQDDLELNLKLLRFEPDAEAQENSLYELGSLLFRRRNYRMSSFRLEEALHLFPHSPRTVLARFHLAECYRSLAAQESQNIRLPERTSPDALAHFQKQYRIWLEKASQGYEELARIIVERQAAMPLTTEDEAILRQASFAAAESRSNLGQYNEAIRLYEPLVTRYRDRVETLHALAGIAQCWWRQGAMDQAKATVQLIRNAMKELDDSAFNQPSSQWSRQEWEKWLAEVSK